MKRSFLTFTIALLSLIVTGCAVPGYYGYDDYGYSGYGNYYSGSGGYYGGAPVYYGGYGGWGAHSHRHRNNDHRWSGRPPRRDADHHWGGHPPPRPNNPSGWGSNPPPRPNNLSGWGVRPSPRPNNPTVWGGGSRQPPHNPAFLGGGNNRPHQFDRIFPGAQVHSFQGQPNRGGSDRQSGGGRGRGRQWR